MSEDPDLTWTGAPPSSPPCSWPLCPSARGVPPPLTALPSLPWAQEAYTEYLRSIHYISQVLLEEVETTKEPGEAVPPDTWKMLKLAEQCLERAQSTAAKLGKTHLKPAMSVASPVPSTTSRHRRVYSDEGGKLSPFLPPEIFQKLQVVESQSSKKELTPLEEASVQNQKLKAAYEARVARLDPSQAMQKTSLTLSLQRQMMENLVIAKAREETPSGGAPPLRPVQGLLDSAAQLQRKMEERRLRLQEAANRRFCSQAALSPEEREQRALYAAILEYEQDHDWPKTWKAKLKRSPGDLSLVTSLVSHLLSVPDHPIAQLLRRLQCAVYRALYPLVSSSAPPASAPGSCSLPPDTNGLLAPGSRRLRPSQSLYCMLSAPEPGPSPQPPGEPPASPPASPLQPGPQDSSPRPPAKDSSFEDLEQFLAAPDRWGQGPEGPPEPPGPGAKKEPLLEQLQSAARDIHNAIDRLLSLTLLAFDGLNTAASKDRCLAGIEEPFFSPLWPLLLAVYRYWTAPPLAATAPAFCTPRSVHRRREAALSRSMELCRNAPPAALGVSTRLLPRDPAALRAGPCPYHDAVQELGLLVLESCPQKKLGCIVRALRVICACAEEYYRAPGAAPEPGTQPSAAAIGADDLLPILSFVVLRSGLPQLVSECAALEEFIHEGFLVGEEGYCLTSLQSALSCVELLPQGPWASGGQGRGPPGAEPPAQGGAALRPCPPPTAAAGAAGRG
ncbi:LOW QUALITY PROTEIN: VPS9 domain-containing protein 1 [Galemys pyrenaicus]|uniref:VPS9 domain-containing protein 1 n=1 Tax=Galemys pyrenaicus TaxID=202257 RepID=A0A8J6DJ94_GALPY|nr:LOW QUALITY PROTEIN: VPS9 domain-containing protein 1 [Galemys pyrenaicus]